MIIKIPGLEGPPPTPEQLEQSMAAKGNALAELLANTDVDGRPITNGDAA